MSQQESRVTPTPLIVKFANTSDLPIPHINAMSIHSGSDEFFFTLGVVMPPNQEELTAIQEVGHIIAQPLYRFAVSRDNMEKFLTLMASQYEQQTALIKELQRQPIEISQEE